RAAPAPRPPRGARRRDRCRAWCRSCCEGKASARQRPPGGKGRLCATRRVGTRAPPHRGDTTQLAVGFPVRLARAPVERGRLCPGQIDFQSILIDRLPYLKVVKYLFTVYKAV